MRGDEVEVRNVDKIVDNLRAARDRPAVLKIQLSNIRGRDKHAPVLVFEGADDVGPYEVWISRIRGDLSYEPLIASGKKQLLEFRESLSRDINGLKAAVFFFVDRDYDGLRGFQSGPDIFCTDRYSIENYLVSEQVLGSLLYDEFRLVGDPGARDRAMEKFQQCFACCVTAMGPINRRLYFASALGIFVEKKEEKIGRYISISVDAVSAAYRDSDIRTLIRLTREPTDAEENGLAPLFERLDPVREHRGKFWLAFFLKWLEQLANERRNPAVGIFGERAELPFNTGQLTRRSLAGRSEIPDGLDPFVRTIAPGVT